MLWMTDVDPIPTTGTTRVEWSGVEVLELFKLLEVEEVEEVGGGKW